jgi:glycosyltransferase involved in cell wall biosynthesis
MPPDCVDHPGADMPVLSIVIPTRDRPARLRDSLATLQLQRAADLEVLVIDDGSTSPLAPVVAGVTGPVPMRCLRQAPAGLNAARNRGVAEASGEIIAFLDDDTLVASGWAGAITSAFAETGCAGLAGRVRLRFEGGAAPTWLARPQRNYLAELDLGPLPAWLDAGPVPVGANCAVRRSEFERVGGFRDGLDRLGRSLISNGDTEFFRRLRAHGGRLRYEPAAEVLHRVPAERLARDFFYARARAQGISDALLDELDDGAPARPSRVARELWRCGRTAPILARGLATGRGTMNARQWVSYCQGRLGATVHGGLPE